MMWICTKLTISCRMIESIHFVISDSLSLNYQLYIYFLTSGFIKYDMSFLFLFAANSLGVYYLVETTFAF